MDKTASAPNAHDAAVLEGVTPAVRAELEKLAIRSAFDLLLHLPLRYLDETRLCPIGDALPGKTVQLEGTVVSAGVKYQPRKMLVCEVEDGSGHLTLRFFNFYGSQLKTLSSGTRLRLLGEVRPGFLGLEMVHPQYRPVRGGQPLAEALTPVYPTTAGLSQAALRKLIARAFVQCGLDEILPAALLAPLQLPPLNDSLRYLHYPPPDASLDALEERTHDAWQRLKFDELLAQQLSMRRHYQRRR
ncbi:MAG TPA: ATP-dependent DNA helicase RecG, partial [Betaproteobacteria bacterium]|nr:ATP-dependent DNA helicase RecG [Betaproteobacteria bacterium]